MGGLIELGATILARAEQRAEVAAQNISNITTPGYKARQSYDEVVSALHDDITHANSVQSRDWSLGHAVSSHNPLDLAIMGNGFFVVRSDEHVFYTRDGQFKRDADGHLLTPDGLILQSTNGDVVVPATSSTISSDGSILDDSKSDQQIAIVDFNDLSGLRSIGGNLFSAPAGAARELDSPQLKQGFTEQSNVSDGTEMLSIMSSLRSAESGQRIVQLYDDLMSQAATSFGQEQG